jgi:predicted nucleotidyltransferase
MHRFIKDKFDELQALCDKHRVLKLELFGSAASVDSFDPETSDLDFLVEFQPMPPVEHADAYFGLLENLQDLFECDVDLVEVKAVSNPYFLESIDRTRRIIYAA